MLLIIAALPTLQNGLARTPPLGWRSWNAYGGGVTQSKMEAAMDAMVDISRSVSSTPQSLLTLGYKFAGLDDGWQACGAGVNGSFHAADGYPLVDMSKFPDMRAMVSKAHKLKLKAGFYMNNCICSEHGLERSFADTVMRRSVAALVHDFGFDGVKLDSCSQFNNLTHWNELINATGKPILLENCHQVAARPHSPDSGSFIAPGGDYTLARERR